MTTKPCKYGCGTQIYWNTKENAFFEAEKDIKHNCPNFKKQVKEIATVVTYEKILEKLEEYNRNVEQSRSEVRKETQIFKAILIKLGLFKTADEEAASS